MHILADLKPANVLLSEHWVAKVADFGASLDTSHLAADSTALHGTPQYMAPEMILRQGHGKAADAWSFGCVLAHMGARAPPFAQLGSSVSAINVMRQVVEGELTPLDLLTEANIPTSLFDLARSCVAVTAVQRPSFELIAQQLTAGTLVSCIRPAGVNPRPARPLLRHDGSAPRPWQPGGKSSAARASASDAGGGDLHAGGVSDTQVGLPAAATAAVGAQPKVAAATADCSSPDGHNPPSCREKFKSRSQVSSPTSWASSPRSPRPPAAASPRTPTEPEMELPSPRLPSPASHAPPASMDFI